MTRWPVVAMLLLAACGSSGEERPAQEASRLDRADRRMVKVVDATAGAVLSGRQGRRPEGDEVRVGCHDAAGRPSGRASAGYTLHFALRPADDTDRLIEQVRAYWSERGFDAHVDRRRSELPAVRAEVDGVRLGFEVVTYRDLAVLEGGTPCLPD